MLLRRCAATAFGLLVLAPGLAACGGGTDLEVGDVVPARDDAQFVDGTASSVTLPVGRLEVTLGKSTTQLAASDNRQLEEIAAPDGSTFVPLTWQYDAATFGEYADYITNDDGPTIDLVSDGASYRLPAPREMGEGSTSFYVLVSGSGKEPSLAVDFDGVTQTLDLNTGERDTGAAAPLYDLEAPKDKRRPCQADVEFTTKRVAKDFTCSVRRVARLPYAGDAWAEPGHTWLVITIRTSIRRFDQVAKDFRSGAVYFASDVESTFRLGDVEASAVIEDQDERVCPDVRQGGCTTVNHVVFDLADKASTRLTVEQNYELTLNSVYGGADARETLELPLTTTTTVR
ncbi:MULTISPECIES: hypothetical protein [unclassified Nocardioides]|uniref:hypothetical protein n=1 Tax=unclassified Nocardioides TaxID=2615069 RepID=UPI0006FAA4D9|nr:MULTISPECIES: hypothetical protein [unclassified Nocardioides]KRA38621.1 hypothetical protein ASD81_08430 [Nocardioides sp. Root614]KRA92581.1 hypothetical protein ASD84_08695 [Nocardioides sp. Root682]